jgi:hypothetical protein
MGGMQQAGNTLLHVAAKHGSMDVAVKLFLAGADASTLNQVRELALLARTMYCASNEQNSCLAGAQGQEEGSR